MASEPLPQQSAGRSILFEDSECTISLSVYPPLMKQEQHAHATPSLTLLLAGSLVELAGSEEIVAHHGSFGLKPDGCEHRNAYGSEGAILLSMSVHSAGLWKAAAAEPQWQWMGGCLQLSRMAAAAVRQQLPFADIAAELLARAPARSQARSAPPLWLSRAKAELADQPDVPLQELASRAGVHRVHLCRSFSRWYGESISGFRMRRRTEIALCGYLHRSAPAAAAAADAGFADQSHFTRTVKRLVGMPPGSLRALPREVT
jgi:AraC family transcriptional regulator